MITLDPSVALPSVPIIEKSVLSVLLNHPEKLYESESLTPDHFYDPGRSAAFSLISTMIREKDQKRGFDVSSFITDLHQRGNLESMGGANKVVSLFNAEPNPYHYEEHLRQLNEFYSRRLAVYAALGLAAAAFGESDPQEFLQAASAPITAIHEAISQQKAPESTPVLIKASLQRYLDRANGLVSARGIPTGIDEIDLALYGLFAGRVIAIGAYPSGGKSVIGSQILTHTAINGFPSLYLPLEMSENDLIDRAVIQVSKVPASAWTDPRGYAAQEDKDGPTNHLKIALNAGATKLIQAPFAIRKPHNKSLSTILAVIRRAHREMGIKVAAIDFIQQIRVPGTKGNREEAMTEISHSIQEIAEELQIAIIVLSQLNSDGDTKHGRVVEEDADAFLQIVQTMDKASEFYKRHEHILIVKDRHYSQGGRKLPLIFDPVGIRFVRGQHVVQPKTNRAKF